jgi:Flp pilus assembly protein TadD
VRPSLALQAIVAIALFLGLAIGSPAIAAPLPGPPDRATSLGPDKWARELERRKDALAAAHRRGKSPAAIVPLLGIVSALEGDVDRAALDAVLQSVATDERRHPLVRSYARHLQANVLEMRGDRAQAQKVLAADGYVLGWQIVGPFDNSGRKGETAVYAPETEPFAADQSFNGKLPAEPLAWRGLSYPEAPRTGYVSLDDRLRPNSDVTGYATAWLHVDAETRAAVHIGTGGPYEVWIEGTEFASGDGYHMAHPLQNAHAITLARGWNRILVKVSAADGMWGFFLRVSAVDGSPLRGLKTQAEPPPQWRPGNASKLAPAPRVASLRGELERAFPKDKTPASKAATFGIDLVEFYRLVHPFDNEDHTAVDLARAVESRAKNARSAMLLATLERDPNEALHALQRGIARARKEGDKARPMLGSMLLEAAWRQQSIGLHDRYEELVTEAWKAAPFDADIELELIGLAHDKGFVWWSLQWLRDLAERHPKSAYLRNRLASVLHAQGRTEEALALMEKGDRISPMGDPRIDLLLDLGRPDDAAAVARQAAEAFPGIPEAHVNVGRLEEARGRKMDARKAMAKAIALAPHDAELHGALGRLLVRSGEPATAAASLRRSLELRPQQPDVRDLLAALDRSAPSDLFARWAVPLEGVAKQPTPKSWKGKDSGILHHRVAVKVLPNGLTERLDHRIIRVLDDRGVRTQAVQALSFDPEQSIVEVRRARVRRKNGAIEELGEVNVVALASAGYRMYYDQRQIRVIFDGLRIGDTLEVAFLVRDIAARNMFDEYFGDIMPLQGMEPRKHVEYVLEAPKDKPIYFNLDGVTRKPTKDGKFVLYRHVADDVPAIKPENGMPGWTEVARFLHASTYKTWNDVGDWYWDLVREQLVVDGDIKKAVATALEGLPAGATEKDKVAAIYEYVVRNTRYVGLEFGIHGYKPYRTTEVLSRRFGDCKDKASLLKVMLGEAGIPSHLVLVRTRDQGTMSAKPASLAVFNHAITYVPSLDLFLDGTAEWSGPTELPSNDQGASVLVVKDGKGAEFREIGVSKPGENVRETRQVITLRDSGSAAVQHEITVTGAAASSVRYRFQSEEQRDERLASAFGDIFPGVEVSDVTTPGLSDIKQPAKLSAKLAVPEWATRKGSALRFRVLGRSSTLAGSLASKSKREHELVLDVPSSEVNKLRYELPRGHKFARTPSPANIESPIGHFTLEVQTDGQGATVRTKLEFRRHRITPAEYPAFREFLRDVDAKLEQDFEVVPTK